MRRFSAVSPLFLFVALSAISSIASALTMEVVLVNPVPILSVNREIDHPQSLGALTYEILKEAETAKTLTFVGGPEYVQKINGRGGEMEVLSDEMMRAYGWCYSIDGRVPRTTMPDQYLLDPTGTKPLPNVIRWFYGYALYDRGKWTKMCVPADHLPAQEN